MPSTAELVFYAIVNYIPYTILALYPFIGAFRFSKSKTAVLLSFYSLGIVSLFVIGYNLGEVYHMIFTYVITLMSIAFYFWAIKSRWGRMLFNLFMMENVSSFVVVMAKCLEGHLFPETIGTAYHWSSSLCTFIVLIPVFPIVHGIVKRFFSEKIRDSINPQIWRYLWLVPVFFYTVWLFIFYYLTPETPLQLALKPGMAIFMVIFLSGQLLIYICMARLVIIFNTTTLLEEENNRLESQALQYRTIQEHIHQVSKLKHDMRHQLLTLCNYADSDQYEELKDYLHEYVKTIPQSKISYCRNATLNMLLVYYAQRCADESINCSININLPERIILSDSEITVMFGNLLENAADACKNVPRDDRYLNLNGKLLQGQLILVFENSYDNEVKLDKSGVLLSTKHSGLGIGTASVKNIVDEHNGTISRISENGKFSVSIIIPTETNTAV